MLSRDPNLARHNPVDYVTGMGIMIEKARALAKRTVRGFAPGQIIGIGVDTTASAPLPVDRNGRPLAFDRRFARNPAAMAWPWKDHTSIAEAGIKRSQTRRIPEEQVGGIIAGPGRPVVGLGDGTTDSPVQGMRLVEQATQHARPVSSQFAL